MQYTVHYIFALLVILLPIGCRKGGCNVVPNTTFNTNISQAEHPNAFVSGGWSYAVGGVCGLIVYNTGNGLLAYDRCSTVDIEKKARVEVEGFTIVDRQSGAKWMLIDGSPSHLAECPLRPYAVRKQGNFYYVSN